MQEWMVCVQECMVCVQELHACCSLVLHRIGRGHKDLTGEGVHDAQSQGGLCARMDGLCAGIDGLCAGIDGLCAGIVRLLSFV